MRTALRYEAMMWRSLGRWIRGRAPTGFGYAASSTPLVWAFLVLSAIELVTVDLLLRHWVVVRIVADVLGLYGLLWMVGLLAMLRTHPHEVTADELILRSGPFVEIRVPRADVAEARIHRQYQSTPGRARVDGAAGILSRGGQTQVDVRLRQPILFAGAEVTEIRLAVDDPGGFVAAANRMAADDEYSGA